MNLPILNLPILTQPGPAGSTASLGRRTKRVFGGTLISGLLFIAGCQAPLTPPSLPAPPSPAGLPSVPGLSLIHI